MQNLKTKHVKQLCYDHLKTLSDEEIRETILPPPSSASPPSLPQDQDMLGDGGEGGNSKESDMENIDPRKEEDKCDRSSGEDTDMDAGDADSTKGSDKRDRSPRKDGELVGDGGTSKGHVQDGEGGEIVITISDVSEGSDEDMETRGTGVAPPSLSELPSAESSSGNWHKPVQPAGPSTAGVAGTAAAASGTTSGGVKGEGRAGTVHQHTVKEQEKTTGNRGLLSTSKHSVEKRNTEEQPSNQLHHTSHAVSRVRPQEEKSSPAVLKEVEKKSSKEIPKVCDREQEREQIHEKDSRKPRENAEQSCAHTTEREPRSKGKERRPRDTLSDSKQSPWTGTGDQIAMVEASSSAKVPEPELTVGSAQLLEMELRRRALEAELRRNNASKHSESRVPFQRAGSTQGRGEILEENVAAEDGRSSVSDGRLSEGEEMVCEDVILLHPEYEEQSEEEEGLMERDQRGQDDGRELLELEERLRQRALQSMLEKKRKNS